jgi:DNA-binding transcriptional regulator YiaG
LLTPSLNLQILPKANPQILQKSPLKSIKSSKKYEINKEVRNNFMNKKLKTLEEEIKGIRKKRGISPEDFEMIIGVSLETVKKI